MRNTIFYAVCFGFGAGVLVHSFFLVDTTTVLILTFIAAVAVVFFTFAYKHERGTTVATFLLCCALGILRFALADTPPPQIFESEVGQKMTLTGLIVDEPILKDTNAVELIVQASSTKIVVSEKQDAGYRYGDTLQVAGVLEKPKNFLTDQGKEFDYVNYLKKDGVLYVMRNPHIEIISSGGGNIFKRALFSFKERFDAVIAFAIPAPESILTGGLILGERAAFSPALRTLFSNTGTIHIVTIGGYHVALVAEWIMKLFSFLPFTYALWAGIISIFFYIIATGGAATTVRAGIMATLALMAQATGRTYGAGRALVVAAVLMVLVNPFILAFDVSFELSFMATIAIIFLAPRLERYFYGITWKWLRDIVTITAAMYLFTLPFVLYKIGIFSLVSLPVNIAIVPFVPAAMIAGFAVGFSGFISSTVARLMGIIAYWLLHYILSVTSFFASLPFAAVTIPDFPLIVVLLIYALFALIFFKHTETEMPVKFFNLKTLVLIIPFFITITTAGFFYYVHYRFNAAADERMQALFTATTTDGTATPTFIPPTATKHNWCNVNGPYPDLACTPGAVFVNATPAEICVKGYTARVRSVSTSMRKKVYAEYGIAYPVPRGSYEVDHFIPLALGGSNDISNLFPEAAQPFPGFHEKDIVEVYLQEEMCSERVPLAVAQKQIATDWLAVYNNLTPDQIQRIKKKYSGAANQ